MAYPDILAPDLKIIGVVDGGVPNSERIALRPNRRVALTGFGIAVGLSAGDAGALPIYDNVFWFPEMIVEPPAWLFVYTGPGTTRQTTFPSGEPALVFHWNRKHTIFAQHDLVPVLFSVGFAEVGDHIPPS